MVSQFETCYFECLQDTHEQLAKRGPGDLNLAKIGLGLEVLGSYYGFCETEKWAPWGGARCRSQILSQWQTLANLPVCRNLAGRVLTSLKQVWRQWDSQLLSVVGE